MKKILIFGLIFLLLIGVVSASENTIYGIEESLWYQLSFSEKISALSAINKDIFSIFSLMSEPFAIFDVCGKYTIGQCVGDKEITNMIQQGAQCQYSTLTGSAKCVTTPTTTPTTTGKCTTLSYISDYYCKDGNLVKDICNKIGDNPTQRIMKTCDNGCIGHECVSNPGGTGGIAKCDKRGYYCDGSKSYYCNSNLEVQFLADCSLQNHICSTTSGRCEIKTTTCPSIPGYAKTTCSIGTAFSCPPNNENKIAKCVDGCIQLSPCLSGQICSGGECITKPTTSEWKESSCVYSDKNLVGQYICSQLIEPFGTAIGRLHYVKYENGKCYISSNDYRECSDGCNLGDKNCKGQTIKKTCKELNGFGCITNQVCNGTKLDASDYASCCNVQCSYIQKTCQEWSTEIGKTATICKESEKCYGKCISDPTKNCEQSFDKVQDTDKCCLGGECKMPTCTKPLEIIKGKKFCAIPLTKDEFKTTPDTELVNSLCDESDNCNPRSEYDIKCVSQDSVGVKVPSSLLEKIWWLAGGLKPGVCLATPVKGEGFDFCSLPNFPITKNCQTDVLIEYIGGLLILFLLIGRK